MQQLVIPGCEEFRRALDARARRRTQQRMSPSQRAVVREVLEKHGALTSSEIATFCELTARQVGRRVHDLEVDGEVEALLEDGEEVRRHGASGRVATVWHLA